MANWKRIEGYEAYEVSDDGRVRRDGRELKQSISTHGYPYLNLCRDGKPRKHMVHRLVCAAFHGPSDLYACHLDGNPRNNRADNLRWQTQKENMHDRWRHGTMTAGERCGSAVLTEEQVQSIRAQYTPRCRKNGGRALARRYGVSHGTVGAIVRRETWGG